MITQTIERTPTVLDTPTGAHALVVLAHPDDEFLVGGLLDQFRAHDVPTHAVIATDGEASDRGNPIDLHNLLRRREAGKALAKYGIDPANQHFLGLPDGAVSRASAVNNASHSISSLLLEYPIRTVVTLGHAGFDQHPDHVATHRAAEHAVVVRALDTPGLQLYGLTRQEASRQIPADPAAKLRRLAYHASQFDIDLSDPNYQPAPGTVEQPGIRLSPQSRANLDRYFLNLHLERYASYSVAG